MQREMMIRLDRMVGERLMTILGSLAFDTKVKWKTSFRGLYESRLRIAVCSHSSVPQLYLQSVISQPIFLSSNSLRATIWHWFASGREHGWIEWNASLSNREKMIPPGILIDKSPTRNGILLLCSTDRQKSQDSKVRLAAILQRYWIHNQWIKMHDFIIYSKHWRNP